MVRKLARDGKLVSLETTAVGCDVGWRGTASSRFGKVRGDYCS
jgi:surface antigen